MAIQDKQIGNLLSFGRAETGTSAKTITINDSVPYGNIEIACHNQAGKWHGVSFYQPWNATGTRWAIMCNNNGTGLNNFFGWINATTITWGFYCDRGTMNATAYAIISDKEKKKNIKGLPSVLEKFKQLKPVSFEWVDPEINREPGKQFLGLIAQDVQTLFPETVLAGTDPFAETQLLSLDTHQLLTVAIKAIQELTIRIEALEK